MAVYTYFGYGTIEGEASLGYNALIPSTLNSFGSKNTGYIKFFSASVGMSAAIGETSLTGLGIYLGGRFLIITEASYPIAGLTYNSSWIENGPVGLGFDSGFYVRQGLWGKDKLGGLGAGLYSTISLLSGSPDQRTPLWIVGLGIMLDVFFTRDFGISGRLELLASSYVSYFSDEFEALGPSFSIGIVLGGR